MIQKVCQSLHGNLKLVHTALGHRIYADMSGEEIGRLEADGGRKIGGEPTGRTSSQMNGNTRTLSTLRHAPTPQCNQGRQADAAAAGKISDEARYMALHGDDDFVWNLRVRAYQRLSLRG